MKKTDLALGIDLGGTKIYAIITDPGNRILAKSKMDTDHGASPEKIAADIVALGHETAAQAHVSLDDVPSIGIAVPSSVDPESGDCLAATNLGWKNFSMKKTFRKLLGRSVYLNNDGNLGILGEYVCGAAQGFKTVIGYCVGTGLGGGILIDGHIHSGNSGLAGELGHAIIRQGGRRCGCGHAGCAEAYCSKIAFVKALKREVFRNGRQTLIPREKLTPETRNIKSKILAKAYLAGDPAVRKVLDEGMYMLGVAAASASAIVAPDCIVLGGGVMEAMGQELYAPFRKSFNEHLFGLDPDRVEIRLSVLGDSAVAMGAAIFARNRGRA